MEIAWAATKSWLLDHGWKVFIIALTASIVHSFGMILVSRIISRSIKNSERFETARDRKLREATLVSLIGSVLRIITWIVVAIFILRELNVLQALTPLLAGAGIVSLVVGLGTQTFIKDFVSGVFIVSENQYRVGDVVELGGGIGIGSVEGTVTAITMRTTTIRDNDGAIHVIPNGGIVKAANKTLDSAKINIEIDLPITADVDKFEEQVNALGQAMTSEPLWHERILESPHFHGVQKFTDEKITVEVRSKTIPAEQWHVSSELKKRLAYFLHSNNFFDKKSKVIKK